MVKAIKKTACLKATRTLFGKTTNCTKYTHDKVKSNYLVIVQTL